MEERALNQLKLILERQGAKIPVVENVNATDKAVHIRMGEFDVVVHKKSKVSEKDIRAVLGEPEDADSDAARKRPNMISVYTVKPSETVENIIRASLATGYINNYFHLKELQIDITQHRMFPPHFLFNEEFKKANPTIVEQFNKFRMKDPVNDLPRMDSLDIGARLVGAHPGDIVYIRRHSDTVGYAPMFRHVVRDANVEQ